MENPPYLFEIQGFFHFGNVADTDRYGSRNSHRQRRRRLSNVADTDRYGSRNWTIGTIAA